MTKEDDEEDNSSVKAFSTLISSQTLQTSLWVLESYIVFHAIVFLSLFNSKCSLWLLPNSLTTPLCRYLQSAVMENSNTSVSFHVVFQSRNELTIILAEYTPFLASWRDPTMY